MKFEEIGTIVITRSSRIYYGNISFVFYLYGEARKIAIILIYFYILIKRYL